VETETCLTFRKAEDQPHQLLDVGAEGGGSEGGAPGGGLGGGGDAGGNGGDCGGGSGGGSDVKICALTVPATVLTRPMGGPNVAEATYFKSLGNYTAVVRKHMWSLPREPRPRSQPRPRPQPPFQAPPRSQGACSLLRDPLPTR